MSSTTDLTMGRPRAQYVAFADQHNSSPFDVVYNGRSRNHWQRGSEREQPRWPPSPATRPANPHPWLTVRQPPAGASTLGLRPILPLTPTATPLPAARRAFQAAQLSPPPLRVPHIERPILTPSTGKSTSALHKLLQHNPAFIAVLRERAAVAALRLIRHALSGYEKVPTAAIHALLADIHVLLPPPAPPSPGKDVLVHAVRAAGHGLDGAQAGLLPADSSGRCPMPECETVCGDACARYDHLRGPARCVLCGGGAEWSQGELLSHLALHLARFL